MLTDHEITLEQEILGTIFSNSDFLVKAKDNINSGMFAVVEHKNIYEAIIKLIDDGLTLDIINFLQHYKEILKEMGGVTYITQVAACSSGEGGFDTKLMLMLDKYKKRKMLNLCGYINEEMTVDKILKNIEKTLKVVYESDIKKEVDVMSNYNDYLAWLYEDNRDTGIKSGLANLDNVLGNFQKGRLISLFARSGIGKTTFAIQIALNMALKGHKILYASGEMSNNEVFSKMAASHCLIKYQDIVNNTIVQRDKDRISLLMSTLAESSFYITNETNIDNLIKEIKVYKLNKKLDVVFVDYINKYLLGASGEKLTDKIGNVTSRLKDLALKEDIVIVLLAQANRSVDRNSSDDVCDKITEADIQDSARIEQDSDQVIALYRNKKLDNKSYRDSLFKNRKLDYNSKAAEVNPNCINAIVLKNRHGKKATLSFNWKGEESRVSGIPR